MLYKQTAEEMVAVINGVNQWLADRGYEIEATSTNKALVDSYMYDHFRAPTGHVNWSESNLQQCIAQLKRQGLITFSRTPERKIDSNKTLSQLDVAVRDARKLQSAAQQEQDLTDLRVAANIIATHNNYPHSKAVVEKAKLASVFDAAQKRLERGEISAAQLLALVEKAKKEL